jgi:hypothetical protein
MLKPIITQLKNNGYWEAFPEFFENRRNEVVSDLLAKAPNMTQQDIDKANIEITIYETLMKLDKWVEEVEGMETKPGREGGIAKLKKLGEFMRLRKR